MKKFLAILALIVLGLGVTNISYAGDLYLLGFTGSAGSFVKDTQVNPTKCYWLTEHRNGNSISTPVSCEKVKWYFEAKPTPKSKTWYSGLPEY